MRKTLTEYSIITKKEKLKVTFDHKVESKSYVIADQEKIETVINNLISNAIKYTSDGIIEVQMKTSKSGIHLSVRNGVTNLDTEQITHIWEPFYVLETSRDKKLSGTGLGLSIVKQILDSHGLEHGINLVNNSIEFYIFFETK